MDKHIRNQKGFIDLAVATFLFGLFLATALVDKGVIKPAEKPKVVNQGVSQLGSTGGVVSAETK